MMADACSQKDPPQSPERWQRHDFGCCQCDGSYEYYEGSIVQEWPRPQVCCILKTIIAFSEQCDMVRQRKRNKFVGCVRLARRLRMEVTTLEKELSWVQFMQGQVRGPAAENQENISENQGNPKKKICDMSCRQDITKCSRISIVLWSKVLTIFFWTFH